MKEKEDIVVVLDAAFGGPFPHIFYSRQRKVTREEGDEGALRAAKEEERGGRRPKSP